MKLTILLPLVLTFTSVRAQSYPECTAEVARSDDCAAVINANACYNKFRWNAQTLTCIDGTDTAVKQKMVRLPMYAEERREDGERRRDKEASYGS
jgi:hypothetical protein